MEDNMKKIISAVIAVVMIAAMITTSAIAADMDDYVSPGNIIVPYIEKSNITIDGTLEQGEWSETNKILLNETNLVCWYQVAYEGPIEYFYSWTDEGLLMAAKVSDDEIQLNTGSGANTSRFQIALNPAGIIKDYNGLFFSFCPVEDEDNVVAFKHNWESSADAAVEIEEEEGYIGKYTLTKDEEDNVVGWNMEVLLPWSVIAQNDRDIDIDDELDDAILLDNFNPNDENRARAFLTAKICYVGVSGNELKTGGTFTDGDGTDWNVTSYDIVLFIAEKGKTECETVTEYFTLAGSEATEPAEDTQKTGEETQAQNPGENVTEAPAKTEEVKNTEAEQGTKAPEKESEKASEKAGDNKEGEKKNNTTLIIIIICVVVAVAVILGIILGGKKKKA